MDWSLQNYKSYINHPRGVGALPTPSLTLSLPILKRNIAAVHQDVEKLGIGFRPHVKTLKCLEVTRMMLDNGKYRGIIASTLTEIRGVLPLVKEGLLDECVYGIPFYPGVLPQLLDLRKQVKIILMIDNEQQITLLEQQTPQSERPWDVFVKLDVGSHRAGVRSHSEALRDLVRAASSSPRAVSVYGFYCHAGHSYGGRTREQAEETLQVEIDSVLDAAKLLSSSDNKNLVVSIGSTPTAHVIASMKATIPNNVKLELHAGNFPVHDLQQVSTGVIRDEDQAALLRAQVCSVYPERNEALINAGAVAISRETGGGFSGFGRVAGQPGWGVVRMSQEHGILGLDDDDGGAPGERVEDRFRVGQDVSLRVNHVCITAAAFYVYYVLDGDDKVVDAWVPWKGW
ncbi:hypothetical protein N3K66_003765 [Trichothecium roseum]|uniref:Uncharacterized protein n=1 Tax=Trichothecium roseum TaxID=47278 RepID=A0ACC0V6W5_9HYPO|nr:hypothetical protein N3K66_003765 [Trichothecium roseum]